MKTNQEILEFALRELQWAEEDYKDYLNLKIDEMKKGNLDTAIKYDKWASDALSRANDYRHIINFITKEN